MAKSGKAAPEALMVTASLVTDCGCVRQVNEDCCQVVMPSDPAVLNQRGVLVVVADGMGGYLAGEVASRIAVETVARTYYASDHDPHALPRREWRGAGDRERSGGHAHRAGVRPRPRLAAAGPGLRRRAGLHRFQDEVRVITPSPRSAAEDHEP